MRRRSARSFTFASARAMTLSASAASNGKSGTGANTSTGFLASVVSRKNTGAGFYTKLKVKQVSKPIEAKVIGNVCADIEGFDQPMLFLLFLRDGVIHQMEGATIDDSMVDIDFSKARFLIRLC